MDKDSKRNLIIALIIFAVVLGLVLVILFLTHVFTFSKGSSNNSAGMDNASSDLAKVYCTSDSRQAQVCSEIYSPVCGYPLMQTFSNSCFACMNKGVVYYTKGQCLSA